MDVWDWMKSCCAWLAKFFTRDVESVICWGRKVSRGIDNEGCSRFLERKQLLLWKQQPETFFWRDKLLSKNGPQLPAVSTKTCCMPVVAVTLLNTTLWSWGKHLWQKMGVAPCLSKSKFQCFLPFCASQVLHWPCPQEWCCSCPHTLIVMKIWQWLHTRSLLTRPHKHCWVPVPTQIPKANVTAII